MSKRECECPMRPNPMRAGAYTRDGVERAAAKWDRVHGDHQWAKDRHALMEVLGPVIDEKMRGREPKCWLMLAQAIAAVCVVLLCGTSQASSAPTGTAQYAWDRIEARAANVAHHLGLGACGEAKLRTALWEAASWMGSGREAAVRDEAPGRARVRDEERKSCQDGSGPGAAAIIAAFVAENVRWVSDKAWGEPIWSGVLVIPNYVPTVPSRVPMPTGRESL